ncbi:hypothetical protein GGF32_009625 [Allomyces javanicus]|nr:hypothetical protein GGF32_009625 [Allomyces javanicus]
MQHHLQHQQHLAAAAAAAPAPPALLPPPRAWRILLPDNWRPPTPLRAAPGPAVHDAVPARPPVNAPTLPPPTRRATPVHAVAPHSPPLFPPPAVPVRVHGAVVHANKSVSPARVLNDADSPVHLPGALPPTRQRTVSPPPRPLFPQAPPGDTLLHLNLDSLPASVLTAALAIDDGDDYDLHDEEHEQLPEEDEPPEDPRVPPSIASPTQDSTSWVPPPLSVMALARAPQFFSSSEGSTSAANARSVPSTASSLYAPRDATGAASLPASAPSIVRSNDSDSRPIDRLDQHEPSPSLVPLSRGAFNQQDLVWALLANAPSSVTQSGPTLFSPSLLHDHGDDDAPVRVDAGPHHPPAPTLANEPSSVTQSGPAPFSPSLFHDDDDDAAHASPIHGGGAAEALPLAEAPSSVTQSLSPSLHLIPASIATAPFSERDPYSITGFLLSSPLAPPLIGSPVRATDDDEDMTMTSPDLTAAVGPRVPSLAPLVPPVPTPSPVPATVPVTTSVPAPPSVQAIVPSASAPPIPSPSLASPPTLAPPPPRPRVAFAATPDLATLMPSAPTFSYPSQADIVQSGPSSPHASLPQDGAPPTSELSSLSSDSDASSDTEEAESMDVDDGSESMYQATQSIWDFDPDEHTPPITRSRAKQGGTAAANASSRLARQVAPSTPDDAGDDEHVPPAAQKTPPPRRSVRAKRKAPAEAASESDADADDETTAAARPTKRRAAAAKTTPSRATPARASSSATTATGGSAKKRSPPSTAAAAAVASSPALTPTVAESRRTPRTRTMQPPGTPSATPTRSRPARQARASADTRIAAMSHPGARKLSDEQYYKSLQAVQSAQADVVIALSSYHKDDRQRVEREVDQLAKLLKAEHGTTVSRVAEKNDEWVPTVTHVLTDVDENRCARRTNKVIAACIHGAWVVSTEWLRACLAANALVPEEPYEVQGDTKGGIHHGPRRNRERRQQEEPSPLAGTPLYLDPSIQPLFLGAILPALGTFAAAPAVARTPGTITIEIDPNRPVVAAKEVPEADCDVWARALRGHQVVPLSVLTRRVCASEGWDAPVVVREAEQGEWAVMTAVYGVEDEEVEDGDEEGPATPATRARRGARGRKSGGGRATASAAREE